MGGTVDMARYRGKHEFDGHEFRSKFELSLAQQLKDAGIKYDYEKWRYEYFTKVSGGICNDCAGTHVEKRQWYTPDFFLPNGIVIEAKGHFTAGNRTTLKAVREAHPTLDLRIVFMANNRIGKNSLTRNTDWAEKHGFQCTIGEIPDEWLQN